jgi:hypothetical protein
VFVRCRRGGVLFRNPQETLYRVEEQRATDSVSEAFGTDYNASSRKERGTQPEACRQNALRPLGFKSCFYIPLRVRSRSLNVAGAVRFRTLDFTKRFSSTLSSTAAAQVLQPAM